ncbi:hypothetical protein [Dokdonia sp. 4H-3-7-5]|uniref:hypothetical protein n=1 Tax=Dokdonia sp. (strain 4H-3-7-5) TaxID=983548 RepID=UPI00020A6BDF|nr:hypothetical protein [Dokdonia sp. 4H-3-7-5]AEE19617.1 hypothetical protein Krodi_1634 [Dokdonia sp. 4H-3-7-5]
MIFEIPFNEEIYNQQMLLNFNTAWKKNFNNNRKCLFLAIPMILVGGLIIYGENNTGFLLVAIGIHYLMNFYTYYKFYQKSKKSYLDLMNAEILKQKGSNENHLWEFDDLFFRYKDHKYEAKIKWEVFKSHRVIENNLFLDIDVGTNLAFILGESEIGTDNFKKATEFVKEKVTQKHM